MKGMKRIECAGGGILTGAGHYKGGYQEAVVKMKAAAGAVLLGGVRGGYERDSGKPHS